MITTVSGLRKGKRVKYLRTLETVTTVNERKRTEE